MMFFKIARDGSIKHSHTKNEQNLTNVFAINDMLTDIIRQIVHHRMDAGRISSKIRRA